MAAAAIADAAIVFYFYFYFIRLGETPSQIVHNIYLLAEFELRAFW
jgi:hypothetical protein